MDRHQSEQVTAVEQNGSDGSTIITEDSEYDADYVVLATGRNLTEEVGCAFTDEDVVDVDVAIETSGQDVYATGAMVRAEEWQAVISAGDGAAATLNILTKEKGEHFHDFGILADAE